MRQCTVRCICDDPKSEAFVRAEKHLCEDCRPDAWVILNFVAETYGVMRETEAAVHLRWQDARKLGKALCKIADDIAERRM